MAATHFGNTTEEFAAIVTKWMATARHPKTGRPYTEMVYQPMLELLAYLRANGFKTFIAPVAASSSCGPGPNGSMESRRTGHREPRQDEVRAAGTAVPVLTRLAEVDLIDDKAGKPVGIQQVIGRRPIAAFGNSDGDFEMLGWTTSAPGPRFGLIVHHTDAERESAYDRASHIGTLARRSTRRRRGSGSSWT